MRISQIEITNFRGIGSGTVVLPQHGVLLGANNVGKTAVVEAIALLFGRDKMVRPTSDWDFFGGRPKPDTRFYIVGTVTGFCSDDPIAVPEWFVGDNRAQPLWWDDRTSTMRVAADRPQGFSLATKIAVAARYDDELCEFELARYFYYGHSDPFTDGYNQVPQGLLRDLGVFLLAGNREWDRLLSFSSTSLLKVVREYGAMPGLAVETLKEELTSDVTKIEEMAPLSSILKSAQEELQSFMLVPEDSRIVYRPTMLDTYSVLQTLTAHVEKDGCLVPIARQGSGLISIQSFLLLLAFAEYRRKQGRDFILLAEEPELHLHPSLHRRLVNRIRSACTQSIVTTHAPAVAASYQPGEAVFLKRDVQNLLATALRPELPGVASCAAVKKLYSRNRDALYEALMGGVVLIPEGPIDAEWLTLWQRAAQASAPAGDAPDFMPTTVIPTSDAAVLNTFLEISRFRPDALPILDGDAAGIQYTDALAEASPAPHSIVRLGHSAAIECLSAWIMEPALRAPGPALAQVVAADASVRTLQKALCASKKDRDLHEVLAWECCDNPACWHRASQFFRDLSMISSGQSACHGDWCTENRASGVQVHVARHICRPDEE